MSNEVELALYMRSPGISTRISNRPLEEVELSMKKESGVGMGNPKEAYAVQTSSKLPSTSSNVPSAYHQFQPDSHLAIEIWSPDTAS